MEPTSAFLKLQSIPVLSSESVKIKDPARVESLLNKLIAGGPSKLQVITDFDRTLTRPYFQGRECLTSFGLFPLCGNLPANYTSQAAELRRVYRPYEVDPNLTRQEKSVLMEEWIRREADLIHFELDREGIKEAVRKAGVPFRQDCDLLLRRLKESRVPCLVFSAGLGDVVTAMLEEGEMLHANMHVISNFLRFDGSRVSGLKGDIIHSCNKNENTIRNQEYFHELDGRENALLMGDALGDAEMADGVDEVTAVLKIGFLHQKMGGEDLDTFMNHFDIVLLDDDTMDVANELLRFILA